MHSILHDCGLDQAVACLSFSGSKLALTPEQKKLSLSGCLHVLKNSEGQPVARCCTWIRNLDTINEEEGESSLTTMAVVGIYAAASKQTGTDLLQRVCAWLNDRGVTRVVGPMDRDTWHRYRLVLDNGSQPPFFLEPEFQPDELDAWQAAGFTVCDRYYSMVGEQLNLHDDRLDRVKQRIHEVGIQLQTLDSHVFDECLTEIHSLSLQAFRHNPWYTPIPLGEFLDLYRPLERYIEPDLVLLAYEEEELVGFLFALPDVFRDQQSGQSDTFIIKTLAVKSGRKYAGLGALLLEKNQHSAATKGYMRVIYALMHESNLSMHLTNRYGQMMRTYGLLSRGIGDASA